MFTGLVETLGTVRKIQPTKVGVDLTIASALIADGLPLGASVAINGVCLTVVFIDGPEFQFQAGPETLRLTNLGQLQIGERVNLERALKAGDRLGGHIVQGHVDGLGKVRSRHPDGEWETIWFDCPRELARQMIRKGSIAVDGISLTLVDVTEDSFSVALIPHTLAVTTLGFKQPGSTVNLETDLFGKYITKYLDGLSLNSVRIGPA